MTVLEGFDAMRRLSRGCSGSVKRRIPLRFVLRGRDGWTGRVADPTIWEDWLRQFEFVDPPPPNCNYRAIDSTERKVDFPIRR
jgi:hypothetical protein